jgi:hypothetical protein
LANTPDTGRFEIKIRRRSSRRHRRNRLIRRVSLVVIFVGLALGFSFVALRHLSPSFFGASGFGVSGFATVSQSGEGDRNILFLTQQESLRQMQNRPVYPYSVVPGGVKSASELKWMAQHDAVVASHYAGFDYEHARMVRLISARTAYVSYRIGNRLYFTRHRIMLRKGETVITDGKITARSRCGNRVEEAPQQATSSEEPPAIKFDQPFLPAAGTALSNPSVPFQSALLNRPALGPALPLGLYDPLGNANWVPIMPPPLPGVCGVGKSKTGSVEGYLCASGGVGGGGTVPEPGTWLLVASGLAAMYWKARQKLLRS